MKCTLTSVRKKRRRIKRMIKKYNGRGHRKEKKKKVKHFHWTMRWYCHSYSFSPWSIKSLALDPSSYRGSPPRPLLSSGFRSRFTCPQHHETWFSSLLFCSRLPSFLPFILEVHTDCPFMSVSVWMSGGVGSSCKATSLEQFYFSSFVKLSSLIQPKALTLSSFVFLLFVPKKGHYYVLACKRKWSQTHIEGQRGTETT